MKGPPLRGTREVLWKRATWSLLCFGVVAVKSERSLNGAANLLLEVTCPVLSCSFKDYEDATLPAHAFPPGQIIIGFLVTVHLTSVQFSLPFR